MRPTEVGIQELKIESPVENNIKNLTHCVRKEDLRGEELDKQRETKGEVRGENKEPEGEKAQKEVLERIRRKSHWERGNELQQSRRIHKDYKRLRESSCHTDIGALPETTAERPSDTPSSFHTLWSHHGRNQKDKSSHLLAFIFRLMGCGGTAG